MTVWEAKVREYQREIDMIRDHAPRFLERLNIVMPQAVYMNMVHREPPLTMLGAIISGNADVVFSSPTLVNATSVSASAKAEERRNLRAEVTEVVRRLFSVIKFQSLLDLLSGAGRVFAVRGSVHYYDVYNEVSMEEELDALRDEEARPDGVDYDYEEWLARQCDGSD